MKNGVFNWIAGALLSLLMLVGGWAYSGVQDDIKIERARVDFYSMELVAIKETVARIEERQKAANDNLRRIEVQLNDRRPRQ